jgi:membrane carboxypeptidase/penicillin-binding protein PbpC
VGYTPELAVGVWVGNANNSPMVNVSGVAGAGPIWHDFMRAALTGKPESQFVQPPGLVRVEVCAMSGLLPTDYCPLRRSELFIEGTQPTTYDMLYQSFRIDSATGLLADDSTPPERIVTQVFLVLPPEAQEWAREKGIPQIPNPNFQNPNSQLSTLTLTLTSPDDATIFNISPRLPITGQQITFSAVSGVAMKEVSFVLNGEGVATLAEPPYQYFWQLAPGRYRLEVTGVTVSGERVSGEAVAFEVKP